MVLDANKLSHAYIKEREPLTILDSSLWRHPHQHGLPGPGQAGPVSAGSFGAALRLQGQRQGR